MGLDGIQRRRAGTERRGSPQCFDPTGPRPDPDPHSCPEAGPRQLRLDLEARATKDVELTGIFAALDLAGQRFAQGKIVATGVDGTAREISLPLARKGLGDAIRQFTVLDTDGTQTVFSLEPPCSVPSDGAARIQLVGSALKADAPARVAITIDLPGDLAWYASSRGLTADPGSGSWYEFKPDRDSEPSEIGMENWIEAPAGQHGRIQRQGDQLVCGGKPIKLWGLNLCYGACAPEKELAEKRARFYRKFGINAVRLHKYAEGGTLSKDFYSNLTRKGSTGWTTSSPSSRSKASMSNSPPNSARRRWAAPI